jgi:outer membrane biosynthesis protein TonB
MNELLQKKQKYGSFAVSSSIHALLLIGLYAVRSIQNGLFENGDAEYTTRRSTPASVTMNMSSDPAAQQATMSQSTAEPKQQIPEPIAQPEQAQKDMASNIEQEQAAISEPEEKQIPEKQEKSARIPATRDTAPEPASDNTETIEDQSQANMREPQAYHKQLIPNGIKDLDHKSQAAISYAYNKVKKKKKRHKISGAQLLQAFRQAYRSEQWGTAPAYTDASHAESGQSAEQRAFVEQRLSRWRYANYNTKVNEALARACSQNTARFYCPEAVHSSITFVIIINKDGSIKSIDLEGSTGDHDLDNYIISVIRTAQFAPIPDHLECSEFKFRHATGVNIDKGYGKIVYHY